MKNIKSKIAYFILPGLITIGGLALVGSGGGKMEEKTYLRHLSESLTMVSLNPPENLNFSGEICPLRDTDVKERFDQQLIRNVFFHSSTIMMLKRAHRYKEEIVSILKKNKIPEDFFYLAVAESNLTNATSPVGAKGFWQFMKETGLSYGLEITGDIDERYDPIKSTYAAVQYLKDSYRIFGNWTLVAASYNMGMRGVENALEKQKVDSYYDLYLNKETSAYVFRILAIKAILEDPDKYGFHLTKEDYYKPIRFKNVVVSTPIEDLITFALENGTTFKMLKLMNPWLLSDDLKVPEGSEYVLHIPYSSDVNANELMVEEEEDSITGIDSLDLPTPAVVEQADSSGKSPVKSVEKKPAVPKAAPPLDSMEEN